MNAISQIDRQFTKVTKFLNGKKVLCLQTFIWSMVAYACILTYQFKDKHRQKIILISCFPPIHLSAMSFIIYYFKPTISSTIANFFGNYVHIYTCLTCIVEMIIAWLITLVKTQMSDVEESLVSDLMIVAVYFIIVIVCELLRLKDRGAINGCAAVMILIRMKRFGFFNVLITAAMVFGKNLICSDCCESCRAQKLITKATEDDDLNEFLKGRNGTSLVGYHMPEIVLRKSDYTL